ncbi:unnamed protein product [Rotaria sp. Silwood2]|nr:unnamed protein product [Rotaria sp. Silwood2]
MGGSGGSGWTLLESVARIISESFGLTLIFPDHRGTGLSTVLGCDDSDSQTITTDCITYLTSKWGIDGLSQFSITAAVHDLSVQIQSYQIDHPGRISIYGMSYGTLWLDRFLQIYPILIQSAVMDGVVNPYLVSLSRYDLWASAIALQFLTYCLQNKIGELVILGLDNAGKTTLLHTLKADPLALYVSTLYSNSEELIMGNIKFTAFDLSGGLAQGNMAIEYFDLSIFFLIGGRVWKDYFPAVDSIVFLVDATDRRRFAKAKAELDSLLTDEQVANTPFVILGTKSDLRGAVAEERLREELGIFSSTIEEGTVDRTNINGRPMAIFMCSVKEQGSFGQAFRWLSLTHLYSTVYHPQTNGQIERFNATMDGKIAALCNGRRTDWDEVLQFVTFNYNTSIHATTKQTPFEMMHGRQVTLPFDQ